MSLGRYGHERKNNLRVVRDIDIHDSEEERETNTIFHLKPLELAYVLFATFALGAVTGAYFTLNTMNSRDRLGHIPDEIIQRYDSDGDGRLNSSELDAYLKRR